MDLPFTPIELVARDPARRIHRRWRVAACRDLFGTLLIESLHPVKGIWRVTV